MRQLGQCPGGRATPQRIQTSQRGEFLSGLKPGTVFGIIYNNTFEQIGETRGSAIYPRTSGLIFNNRFINVSNTGSWSAYRSYSAYYFTEQLRMRELYIFDNHYTNSRCTEDSNDCFSSFDSKKNRSWIGENATYFFRPPGPGERTFPFITHEAVIGDSHPLTAGDPVVPKNPQDEIPSPTPVDDMVACENVIALDSGWLTPCGIVHACNPRSAAHLIDHAYDTIYHHWETESHWITLDLGLEYNISRIRMNHNQWTTTNAVQEVYVSSDATNWGSSLGNLPAFRNEESGWKETNISPKRGRYLRLVSESTSSPYWSELEVYVDHPLPSDSTSDDGNSQDAPGDDGSSQEDNDSGGSSSGCFLLSLSN